MVVCDFSDNPQRPVVKLSFAAKSRLKDQLLRMFSAPKKTALWKSQGGRRNELSSGQVEGRETW
ncbi:MAG: hypothetical protein FD138_123 [Planctomycetota bacterium]|nr:MAG: hypothetical protein FD138_123 [Planctomycetota bacterium]